MDSIFGNLEEFGAEVVYPNRWLFALLALAVLGAVAFVAYRSRWDRVLMRHKVMTAVIVIPVLAVGIPAGYYTLSPLWERSTLVEAAPEFDRTDLTAAGIATPTPEGVASETATETDSPTQAATPREEAAEPMMDDEASLRAFGTWSGADDFHFAEGEALIIETEPGVFILRVENFSVRNGPDLFVYLSPDPDGYADGAIHLGRLNATDGAFNYEIPADVDVTQFQSAVVWCKQFSVLFGSAPLTFTDS